MQPGSDGAPMRLKSKLLYHPELRGWSLGLMGGPLIEQHGFKIKTPMSYDSDLRISESLGPMGRP